MFGSRFRSERDGGSETGQNLPPPVTNLGGAGGPVWNAHRAAGGHGSAEVGAGIGEIGLHGPLTAGDRSRCDDPLARCGVIDDDAGLTQHGYGHPHMFGAGCVLTGVPQVQPVAEPGPGQQQRGDELRGATGVDGDLSAVHESVAAHTQRQMGGCA